MLAMPAAMPAASSGCGNEVGSGRWKYMPPGGAGCTGDGYE
jgi:hypothetical protein